MTNPFSTRNIRPGAVDFLFPPGESAARLVDRLRASHWLGQIVGPHGSGKSTLLAALGPAFEAAGRVVLTVQPRNQESSGGSPRVDAAGLIGRVKLGPDTQLVIDGYEQLSWWTRKRTEAKCRRRGAGLLVTTHQDLSLPTIFTTQPTLALAQQVVHRLLGDGDRAITTSDVQEAWDKAGGNLRETLFKLYDVYQSRCNH